MASQPTAEFRQEAVRVALTSGLNRNIVKARRWYGDICKGTSFADIAERDGVSKRRVQHLVDLAFLSPALIEQIAAGTQPNHLTTDALIKSGFPVHWEDQFQLFARADATRINA